MKIIKLIVGSESGTAEFAGHTLSTILESHGHQVELTDTPTLEYLTESMDYRILVVIATAGNGELPANLRQFWRKLSKKQKNLQGLCIFQSNVATDSSGRLPPIPFQSCHLFQ